VDTPAEEQDRLCRLRSGSYTYSRGCPPRVVFAIPSHSGPISLCAVTPKAAGWMGRTRRVQTSLRVGFESPKLVNPTDHQPSPRPSAPKAGRWGVLSVGSGSTPRKWSVSRMGERWLLFGVRTERLRGTLPGAHNIATIDGTTPALCAQEDHGTVLEWQWRCTATGREPDPGAPRAEEGRSEPKGIRDTDSQTPDRSIVFSFRTGSA
jgi:hypothetical protein